MSTELALRGLTKRYGADTVLRDVDLTVPAGSITAVVGPSGSGKTTLLRLVAGFARPDAGSVRLGGDELASGAAWVAAHRRGVGYVAQDGALFPHLSVARNIAFGLGASLPVRRRAAAGRVAELLETVSLDPALARRYPHELSGGQQQRVALARALAGSPRIMLLDESFSALDAGLRVATRAAVAEVLGAAGITTVLVTHDQAEALSFADQVAVLRDGALAQVGPPARVYARPASESVARFLGDVVVLDGALDGAAAETVLGWIPVAGADGAVAPGPVPLLLRPEQIRIAGEGVPATVVRVEFFGPDATVTLTLADGTGIEIRHPSTELPAPGDEVRLRVTGAAVLLDDAAAQR
ncbi:sugar ABC transporter [Tsukamurella pulmonis]|uniref:ABC-type quaternary amine transporter n=1 Tax=Tsukamurella pulmonis TaxID=47312 RepID=A0A1H1FRR4_9ACTN|nr:ABC transporter ATP-binding protein [Tsukamurella pulmonis]KXO87656.1 sugar ABC transporter [Tsukamurella pulmonis]SDR03692.1 iron(III) transport system ATP-binding protein [Tsukamurella pulmonis]SUP18525.1 Fe(3+) ions import ATP-binding protein FbpC [Tsukamurella pulmonis]